MRRYPLLLSVRFSLLPPSSMNDDVSKPPSPRKAMDGPAARGGGPGPEPQMPPHPPFTRGHQNPAQVSETSARGNFISK